MSDHLNQNEIDALLQGAAGKEESKEEHQEEYKNEEKKTTGQVQGRPVAEKVEFSPFNQRGKVYGAKPQYEYFDDIELVISGELGTAEINVRELLKLKEGSVIKLNKMAGESSTVLANEQFLGYAEIVIINDRFGLRMRSIGQEE